MRKHFVNNFSRSIEEIGRLTKDEVIKLLTYTTEIIFCRTHLDEPLDRGAGAPLFPFYYYGHKPVTLRVYLGKR